MRRQITGKEQAFSGVAADFDAFSPLALDISTGAIDTEPQVVSLASLMKKVIAALDAPKAIGPYSQAIATGRFLFCSGQIPIHPETGNLIEGDVAKQTTQVLENLGALLRANAMSYANVVKTTVFLVDLANFSQMNEVYARYFPDLHPARSTIQVAALPKGAQVEIEAIAVAQEPAA